MSNILKDWNWIHNTLLNSIPKDTDLTVSEWCKKYFRVSGGPIGDGSKFLPDVTPWVIEPLNNFNNPTIRRTTIIAPAQASKSLISQAGEAYWIVNTASANDNIMHNYESTEKAEKEWRTRLQKQLENSEPIKNLWPKAKTGKSTKGITQFLNGVNLIVQGVISDSNLTSTHVKYLINDEVHAWEPGKLQDSINRTRGYQGKERIVNVSTGSNEGDQLHQQWLNSTQQEWIWECPCCKKSHIPQIKREEDKKGGLIYTIHRMPNGQVDQPKTKETIRYEFPCCGYQIKGSKEERVKLNNNGKYSSPVEGSNPEYRGYRISGLIPSHLDWLTSIIIPFDNAMLSKKQGDKEPLKRWINEVEGGFFKKFEKLELEPLKLTKDKIKSKVGIPNRIVRLLTIDYQRGTKEDNTHFWAVIRDHDISRSLLVWEGRLETKEQLLALAQEYGVSMVFIDSGYNQTYIYKLCFDFNALNNNITWIAVKGHHENFTHILPDNKTQVTRIYSPTGQGEVYAGNSGQIEGTVSYILYNTQSLKTYLNDMRNHDGYSFEIPTDVSQDYVEHLQNEELVEMIHPKSKEKYYVWDNKKRRNDLLMCEAYQMLGWKLYLDYQKDSGNTIENIPEEKPIQELPSDMAKSLEEPPF